MKLLKLTEFYLDQLKHKVVGAVVNHPYVSLSLALMPILVLFFFLPRIEEDYTVRMWFRTTDPHLIELDQFERKFGNDQVVLFGFKSKEGAFTPKNVQLLHQLTEETWKVTDVIRVESLSNYNFVSVEGDNLRTDPFLPEDIKWNEENLKAKKEVALLNPNIVQRFTDKKGQYSLIHAQLTPKLNEHESNYRLITDQFKALIKKYEQEGVEFVLLGSAPLNDAFREMALRDILLLIPISLSVIALILFVVLRTWAGVLVPLGGILIVILSCFGLAGLLGIKYNNTTSAIPGIMLAICLAEIMHILVVYYRYCDQHCQSQNADFTSRQNAMRESLDKNFYATFLTAITTTFGFVGQISTELTPISDMGVLASYGTVVAWFVTIFFIAPIIMLIPYRKINRSKFFDVRLFKDPAKFVDSIYRHYGKIILSVLALLFLSLYFASKVEVNSEPFSYFKDSYQLKKDNNKIIEEFKGLSGPQLVLRSGSEGGVNDPLFLKKVEAFEKWIENRPSVNQVISLLDIIKDLNQNLNQGDPHFHSIPNDRKQIAEQIFLYTLALPAGMDINNMMSVDQESIRFNIFWSLTDNSSSLQELDLIEKKGKELGLNISVTGKLFLYLRMNDYVVDTFNSSNIWAIILIGSIMMIIFRSFKLGFMSLIPNVIPLIYGMGFLGLMGGHLDIGTSLVTSVCLGITVDDTIHFLLHYSELRKKGLGLRDSLIEIYDITAPSLIFNTLLLVCGFGVFILGDFVPNIYFGVLCAVILTIGVFLELFFTPALLIFIESKESKSP